MRRSASSSQLISVPGVEAPPPAYRTPSDTSERFESLPSTPRNVGSGGQGQTYQEFIAGMRRQELTVPRGVAPMDIQELHLQGSRKFVSKEGDGDNKREREVNSPPLSEEERRREAIATSVQRENEANRQRLVNSFMPVPMNLDQEGPTGAVPHYQDVDMTQGATASTSSGTQQRPEGQPVPASTAQNPPPMAERSEEGWVAWMMGVDEERKHLWGKLSQFEAQMVQCTQILAQVAQSGTNTTTEVTRILEHIQRTDAYHLQLDQRVHTLCEDQLALKQEVRAQVQQGVTEQALKYITEKAQHASAELDLRAEDILTRLHTGWVQERDILRETALQHLRQQQPAALSCEEVTALTESSRQELQREIRHFVTYLEHEKSQLESQWNSVSGQAQSPQMALVEQRINEMMESFENLLSQWRTQLNQQAGMLLAIQEKFSSLEGGTRTVGRDTRESGPALVTAKVMRLSTQNERVRASLHQMELQQRQSLPSAATCQSPQQPQRQPQPPQQPPTPAVPSSAFQQSNPIRLSNPPVELHQLPGQGLDVSQSTPSPQKKGFLSKIGFIDEDDDNPNGRPALYYPTQPAVTLTPGRQAAVRVGEGQARGVHPSAQMGMFPFVSPLQQHAQQFLQPPHFDGQPKNWPGFIRKWDEYVKSADTNGLSSGREKSAIFKNYLPDNLRKEMDSFLAQGNSFASWINRLTVRFGNPSELERRQWHELRMDTKGSLKIADWRSFIAVFLEYQLRVRATQDEAMAV